MTLLYYKILQEIRRFKNLFRQVNSMNYNKLNPEEERVIIGKATEPPFAGEYDNFYNDGTSLCRSRTMPLFSCKSTLASCCRTPRYTEYCPNAIGHAPTAD